MSDASYPYDEPQSGPDRQAIRGRVLPPAIFLIIANIISLLFSLGVAANGVYVLVQGPDELRRKTLEGLSAMPEMRAMIEKQDKQTTFNYAVAEYLGGGIVWIILSLVALAGAFFMMSLRAYGFAVTSALLTAIPCVTPCCLLGQAAGIWALVVLMNNDVRAAFR